MGLFNRKKSAPKSEEQAPPGPPTGAAPGPITFIENAGACMAMKSILSGERRPRFAVREDPTGKRGFSGWIFFGDGDSDEYVADNSNWAVVDYNTVCNIEPAFIATYGLPIGSDIDLILTPEGKRFFVDAKTGQRLPSPYNAPE